MTADNAPSVKLVTHLCAAKLHEWCSDVPTSLTDCECPCHAGSDDLNPPADVEGHDDIA